jgi:hypothetical protein
MRDFTLSPHPDCCSSTHSVIFHPFAPPLLSPILARLEGASLHSPTHSQCGHRQGIQVRRAWRKHVPGTVSRQLPSYRLLQPAINLRAAATAAEIGFPATRRESPPSSHDRGIRIIQTDRIPAVSYPEPVSRTMAHAVSSESDNAFCLPPAPGDSRGTEPERSPSSFLGS